MIRVSGVLSLDQKGIFRNRIAKALTTALVEPGDGALTPTQAASVLALYKKFLEESGGQKQLLKVKAIRLSALFEALPRDVPANFSEVANFVSALKDMPMSRGYGAGCGGRCSAWGGPCPACDAPR